MVCSECPMVFDPELAGVPADDERGGVYTGWTLPPGAKRPARHEHDLAICDRPECDNYTDAADGSYCSPYCRNRDIIERG